MTRRVKKAYRCRSKLVRRAMPKNGPPIDPNKPFTIVVPRGAVMTIDDADGNPVTIGSVG
jgi:hypothetical protein